MMPLETKAMGLTAPRPTFITFWPARNILAEQNLRFEQK